MSESILMFFQDLSTPVLDIIMNAITFAGEQLIFIAVITYIIWNVSKKGGYILTYTLMSSSALNGILKLIVHSPRPFQVIEGIEGKRLATAEGYAFPSGHTQGATTFYTSLALSLKRRSFMVIAIILSLIVGISRLYLGVHWPIDVIGGFTLGLLFTLIMYQLLPKILEDPQKRQRLNLYTAGLSGLVLIVLVPLASGDSIHNEQYHSLIKLFSIMGGFTIGSYLEEKMVGYSVEASRLVKLLRFFLGLIGAVAIMYGGKYLLPDHEISTVIRYAGASIWAFYLFPLIGVNIKIDSEGNRLFSR